MLIVLLKRKKVTNTNKVTITNESQLQFHKYTFHVDAFGNANMVLFPATKHLWVTQN